jgi:FkbM family methyltransferase
MRVVARRALRAALSRSGHELDRVPRPLLARPERRLRMDLDHLLARRLLDGTDLFFVQVGAFDGRTGDQIYDWVVRYRWRGILVEPQPDYFEALQRTYAGHPQLDLRRVAISDAAGKRTLYVVRNGVAGLPSWAPQVASFDRAHLVAHGMVDHDGAGVIEALEVDCLTFSDILAGVEHVDLLQVDAEGYDAEIVRMFDFARYRPSIVRFESKHLDKDAHDAAVGRLLTHGYSIALTADDTIAAHPDWR